MKGHTVYRKKDDIVTRRIAGETILVPVCGNLADMQRLFSLSGVGEFIWERIDGSASLEAIREGIMERFEVDREESEADLVEFTSRLLDSGLIEEAG